MSDGLYEAMKNNNIDKLHEELLNNKEYKELFDKENELYENIEKLKKEYRNVMIKRNNILSCKNIIL